MQHSNDERVSAVYVGLNNPPKSKDESGKGRAEHVGQVGTFRVLKIEGTLPRH